MMQFTIRVEHQIITLTALEDHRTCQVQPSASSVSQEMLRGEAVSSVCFCTTWRQTAATLSVRLDLKTYQMSFSAHTVRHVILQNDFNIHFWRRPGLQAVESRLP